MASISTGGSGLDIASLVSQLVTATRLPTEKRITAASTTASAKLSAVGQVKSALTSLQSALQKVVGSAGTAAFKAAVPTDAGFTASTSDKAVPGSYSVEVVRLATAQKLASAGYEPGATVGAGTLEIDFGGEAPLRVDVEETHTLSDIAAAVNRAAGGKNVVASVVKADDGEHLVFSATNTGSAGALTISATNDDGSLLALTSSEGGGLHEKTPAQDALVRVDGFERVSSSNTVEGLVPGVTLNLASASEGKQHTLSVNSDTGAIKTALAGYVSAYNSTMSTLKSTSSYDANTRSASPLTGDALVRNLQSQLRGQFSGNMLELKALGITVSKEGTMSFSADTFDKAHAADPAALERLFGKESAYATPMQDFLKVHLDTAGGTLVARTEGLNKQLKQLEEQLDTLDVRMERLATLYTSQFTAMETMIMQLQGSASSLNDLLSSGKSG